MMTIPEDILMAAKKIMYQFGHLEPTLFVFGTKGSIGMLLPFGETSDDRAEIMTRAGIQMAKTGGIGELEKVIYVSEAWVSPPREPYIPPSQDPNRQEVLLFNVLDAKTHAQALEIYTCTRNGRQDVIDLKVMPKPGKATVESRVLTAFMTGFRLFER